MRITPDGRITIPEDLRERYGLTPGTEVRFEVDGDGLRIRRAAAPVTPLSVQPYPGKGAALVALTLAQPTTDLTPEDVAEIYGEED